MQELGKAVAKADVEPASDTALGVRDDPDGPLLQGPAELPLLCHEPENLPVLERPRRPPEWLVRLGVLALACALFLPNLGAFGLWDPWETHYGEVTRYMIESGDWVHPWWGYRGEKLGGEEGPGEHFYSKPILLFWMEAVTVRALGLSELSIRIPVALIAIMAFFVVYYCFSKLWGRPKGFLAALVMATSPQFFFLARQSQTDLPFVGTMTVAMSFFALALFGPREKTSNRRMWAVLGTTLVSIVLLVAPQLGIIAADVNHPIPALPPGEEPTFVLQWKHMGWMQAATYAGVLLLVYLTILAPVLRDYRENGGRFSEGFKDQLRRKCYLWMFYAFCGVSTMGKGLLGFMLPGAIVLAYLLLTNEWTTLAQPHGRLAMARALRGRAELLRGLPIFLCVALPWYAALLAGPEGTAFYNRFFIHDHFNRLGSGVHALDDGTFEHFLKWLGYGMWPWVALMPAAVLATTRLRLGDRSPDSRLRLFLVLWFFVPYALFTMSSTKFHHYIFPALPPLAMLIAWTVVEQLRERSLAVRACAAIGLAMLLVLGWDIHDNPQHLRNLFTYKYDREYPSDEQRPIDREQRIVYDAADKSDWEPDLTWEQSDFYKHTPERLHTILNMRVLRYENWMKLSMGVGALALVLMCFVRLRFAANVLLGLLAVAMTLWALNYYMGMLSPHWSQKYLFDRYYDTCVKAANPPEIEESFTPLIAGHDALVDFFEPRGKQVCKEEVISWLLTWRGETYYSNNAIRPIQKEREQFPPYLEQFNRGARFFVFVERTRAKGFKGRVDSHLEKLKKKPAFAGIGEYAVTLEHNENYWFVLLRADPVCTAGYVKDEVGRCIQGKPPAAGS